MILCNSLGSNFTTLAQAFAPLVTVGGARALEELTTHLEGVYGGKAVVLYKGREALELALQLSHVPAGSFVAITGFTCYAVYKAIVNQQLRPAYLDIEPGTLNFSATALETALKTNLAIKVVIIQNTLGYVADVPEIQALCQRHGVVLIEDLAHSIGSTYSDGSVAGTLGDFAVLSCSQDKVIDSVSGGALIIKNKAMTAEVRTLAFGAVPLGVQVRDRFYPLFSWSIRATHSFGFGKLLHWFLRRAHLLSTPMADLGRGFHALPAWQCRLALRELMQLSESIKHRQAIARVYTQHLPKQVLVATTQHASAHSSCLRFPITVSNRSQVLAFLATKQIYLSDTWYDAPVAPKNRLSQADYNHQCPHAETLAERIMNLPTHRSITEQQAQQLAEYIAICQA